MGGGKGLEFVKYFSSWELKQNWALAKKTHVQGSLLNCSFACSVLKKLSTKKKLAKPMAEEIFFTLTFFAEKVALFGWKSGGTVKQHPVGCNILGYGRKM